MAPLGILAPRASYFFGSLRYWTNSMISVLASSQPATSLKRTLAAVSTSKSLAFDFPTEKMSPPPPGRPLMPLLESMKKTPTSRMVGPRPNRRPCHCPSLTCLTGM